MEQARLTQTRTHGEDGVCVVPTLLHELRHSMVKLAEGVGFEPTVP